MHTNRSDYSVFGRGRSRRFGNAAVLAMLVFLLLTSVPSAATAQQADSGSISGVVTNDAGIPLAGIFVCPASASLPGGSPCASTGTDGSYVLEALPASADYRIDFISPTGAYLREYYDDADFAQATLVEVIAGQSTAGIDAELAPAGTLSGTVTNGDAEPLADIQVCVSGGPLPIGSCVWTAADGTYSITGLEPAPDYVVNFFDDSETYDFEFYDNTQTNPTPIPVVGGQNTPNIDAILEPAQLRCNTSIVTVNIANNELPTNGPDVILGTEGPDIINGLAGDDIICGLGGDDIINGGSGDDFIYGDDGNDTLNGQGGIDNLFGRNGDDRLNGGVDEDFLFGDDGNDDLRGQGGDDSLFGEAGVDQFFGGSGNDFIETGPGGNLGTVQVVRGGGNNDTIIGSPDADLLEGGSGLDTLFGRGGDDVLKGGIGADTLHGEAGNDRLEGGATRDLLFGGEGDDVIFGGIGNDDLFGEAGDDTLNGQGGTDVCDGGAGIADTASTCETEANLP